MGHLGGEGVEGFGHLDRQFPGGGEHQHLGGALVGVDRGQQGQGEGGRFTRTGLGLADQVAAEQQLRDGRFLDRRRLLIANRNQGFEQFRREAEMGKTVSRFGVAFGVAVLQLGRFAGLVVAGGGLQGASDLRSSDIGQRDLRGDRNRSLLIRGCRGRTLGSRWACA